ncbi:hypothetical protein LCGC14_0664710 [marine sediment metagenome]|uniref:Uncharacterized protein n=1 Tax=marine sediment metagenome TaxID=412755 RepID=A0A0F9QSI0_9ZZZZ
MKYKIEHIFIGLFITFALLISIEQYISYGSFFEFKDVHHEMFIIMFLFGAFVIVLLYYLKRVYK